MQIMAGWRVVLSVVFAEATCTHVARNVFQPDFLQAVLAGMITLVPILDFIFLVTMLMPVDQGLLSIRDSLTK